MYLLNMEKRYECFPEINRYKKQVFKINDKRGMNVPQDKKFCRLLCPTHVDIKKPTVFRNIFFLSVLHDQTLVEAL